MPYAVEDCIPATATKTGFFAVDVYIDSPTTPNDTSHWIGLELLKSSVGADYQTTGILIILHYNGTIEVLGGTTGIDVATIDNTFIASTSTTFTTHWGAAMTKVTIHVVGNVVKVYVDDTLMLSFLTSQSGGFHSLAKYGNVNAYFDTFIMRSYVEPNPDQTTWGVEEILAKRIVYSADVDLAKYGIIQTANLDVILGKTIQLPYFIDVDIRKSDITKQPIIDLIIRLNNITKQDQIDVILKELGVPKQYTLDVGFATHVQKPYNVDVDFKITSLKPYSADVILKFEIPLSYQIDIILKMFDIPKSYLVDVVFKKLGIPLLIIVDAIIKKQNIPVIYSIDALEKKFGLTKPYSFDTLLKKLNIPVDYSVDVILKKLNIPASYMVDIIFTAVVTANYSIDIVLYKQFATKEVSYMLDIILTSALAALGGGQPTGRIEITVKYIDHNYEYEIGPLDLIKKAHEKIIPMRGLNTVIFHKTERELVFSKLSTVREFQTSMLVKPLNVIGKHSQDFPVSELKIIIFSMSYVEVQPFDVLVSAGNKSIDYSPLDITNEVKFYVPVSGLDVVKESIHQISISSLTMRDKSKKQKEIMDLFDALDEMD